MNFESLIGENGLNQFLETQLQIALANPSHPIDPLVRIIWNNRALLNKKDTNANSLIQFLKVTKTIKDLSKSSDRHELKKVIRMTAKPLFAGDTRAYHDARETIVTIKDVDKKLYYKTLAGWADVQGLDKLKLDEKEILAIAPYLNRAVFEGDLSDKFLAKFLMKAINLTSLTLENVQIEGTALDKLDHCTNLKKLYIFDCPNFNHRLPRGLTNLKVLEISNCEQFDQSIPTDITKIEVITFPDCPARTFKNLLILFSNIYKVNQELARNHVYIWKESVIDEGCLALFAYLTDHYPDHVEAILEFFDSTKRLAIIYPDILLYCKRDKTLSFSMRKIIETYDVQRDPIHQLYLYSVCARISFLQGPVGLYTLFDYLHYGFEQTLSESLKQFYLDLLKEAPRLVLNQIHVKESLDFRKWGGPPLMAQCLRYLRTAAGSIEQSNILHNLWYLFERGMLSKFCAEFTPSTRGSSGRLEAVQILHCNNLFIGIKKYDRLTLALLSDLKRLLEGNAEEIEAFNWGDFEKKLQMHQARVFILKFSSRLLSHPISEKLLLKHYPIDDPLNKNLYPKNRLLCASLIKKYPDQSEQIKSFFEKTKKFDISFDVVMDYFEMEAKFEDSRFIFEWQDRLQGDPVKQLYIYSICCRILGKESDHCLQVFSQYLSFVFNSTTKGCEEDFYMALLQDPHGPLLNPIQVEKSLVDMKANGVESENLVDYLRYLRLEESQEGQQTMLTNLQYLGDVGLFDDFWNNFDEIDATTDFLKIQNLFVGDAAIDRSTLNLYCDLTVARHQTEFEWNKFEYDLQKPSARHFLNLFSRKLLKEDRTATLLIKHYPPELPENVKLYPIEHFFKKNILYLDLLPKAAREEPDVIINLLEPYLQKIRKVDVRFYGQLGVDRGALGRQLFSEVFIGIFLGNSSVFKFEKMDNGKWVPKAINAEKISETEIDYYEILGMFLGHMLVRGYPAGQVFTEEFLRCIYLFTKRDLRRGIKINEKFSKLDNVQLLEFIRQRAYVKPAVFQLVEKILTTDQVFEAATTLNLAWDEPELTEAIEYGDWKAIKQIVRNLWSAAYKGYFEIAEAIAFGISNILNWNQITNLPFVEFAALVQGVVSGQTIKSNLVFESNDAEAKANLQNWVNQWIDDHEDDQEVLGNLVQTFTGGRTLLKFITFRLLEWDARGKKLEGIFSHSCFNIVDVPIQITESELRAAFDAYGRGELLDFTER